MTRRHPHVFGDETADTVEDVVRVWRAAKAAEKASRRSAFDGVPRAMPPLERAVKLLERLEERGDADAAVASVVGSGVGLEARGPSAAPAADDGVGTVDAEWGRAVLGEVAAAARRGVDPVASLRAAVSALEEAGRAVE
jgi:ATP diphosphatase